MTETMTDPIAAPSRTGHSLTIRCVGGPTAIVEIGGLRLLTDPTFDPPGDYTVGARTRSKTAGPALRPDELGPIDAVLLSHDQHPDNLDRLGRAYVTEASLVLSTASARDRLGGNVRALPNWGHVDLLRPEVGALRVTGVPAQHGPDGTERLVGEVTGFVLAGEDLPTVYVSGDNASLAVVRAIAAWCGPIDVALVFAGGARTALVGDAYVTLPSDEAVEAARILQARHVVPLHYEGWSHYTQGADTLRTAFTRSGLADRLRLLRPGEQTAF
jgi:L-ascorbate metabolism protein UlaG (beta-lactamase superfamily)